MSQEINIKLRADTREAVKSVQELERQVSNLEQVQRRGDADNGFLSQNDVKQFRRMAEEAERVYQQFAERINNIKRDLQNRKNDLAEAVSRGAGQSTIDNLQRQVAELEARRNVYQSQHGHVDQLRQQGQERVNSINDMNTPGMMSNMLMMTRRFLPMLGLTLGASALFGMVRQGANQIKVDEAYMSKLGQRVGGYEGDFEKARKDAESLGLKNGNAYSAMDTMQVAENWSSQAGSKSKKDLWEATTDIQTTSRVMGLSPDELASQMGSLGKLGALSTKDIKAFREGMVGAIKETGMAGRDREFVQAVTGLSQQVGRGQMEFSNGELNQVLGLQTILGKSGQKGLQGEKGAEVLGMLDAGVKGNDTAIDIMLGWGTKFNGPQGRAELERMKGRGIGDPELMKELMTNVDGLYGGDKDQQALWLKDKFGVSMEQADALLQDDTLNQLKKGGMSKKEIEKVMNEGAKSSSKKETEWQDSQAQRRAENDAKWENTKKFLGSPFDKAWEGIKEGFLSQPEWLQSGELVGGGLAGGLLGTKALGGLQRMFAGRVGGAGGGMPVPGTGAVGALKTAGKFLGPIGTALSADSADKWAVNSMDWMFGHKKGDMKREGGLFRNPFNDPGEYKDDREGAIPKFFKDIFGTKKASAAELSPAELKQAEEKRRQLSKQEQLTTKEEMNILRRKSQTEGEHGVLDKEKKNLDEMKTLMGSESGSGGAGSSTSGGSGGGFFSKMWEGIKGFFGGLFGGGSQTASASGFGGVTPTGYSKGGQSASQYQNMGLASKSDLTAQDINKWIAEKAPKNSIMQGKGEVFLRAAQESGLDARYLVAHAAHETGWGTSKISKEKGNMYGIGAFDASPYSSAYGYNGTDAGIVEGAKWIAQNYTAKGQDTLQEMRHNGGKHEYATDPLWDEKIAGIMAGGPKGTTNTLNVNVKGSIDGLTPENNRLVTQALTSQISSSNNVQLAYEFRQGIGGNL